MHIHTHCSPVADAWNRSQEFDCCRRWCNDCNYYDIAGVFNNLQTVTTGAVSLPELATYIQSIH